MVIGESRVTNMVLKMLGTDVLSKIDNYVNDICSKDFLVMKSLEQINNIFNESLDTFLSSLSEEELMDLRSYTGYNFRNINAVLRNNWNYQINGLLTNDKLEEYKQLSNNISNILSKFIMPNIDMVTFRGTTIRAFSNYGISDIEQLSLLKGKFLYEQGFTSTSILEDTCYFNKELDDGDRYNIEIRYLVSSECNDGALLINNDTSYSTNQNEFLLNKGALSKVIDVKIDGNSAILTVVLIPKKIYDLEYNKSVNSSKNI